MTILAYTKTCGPGMWSYVYFDQNGSMFRDYGAENFIHEDMRALRDRMSLIAVNKILDNLFAETFSQIEIVCDNNYIVSALVNNDENICYPYNGYLSRWIQEGLNKQTNGDLFDNLDKLLQHHMFEMSNRIIIKSDDNCSSEIDELIEAVSRM
ncbi:hypothetical protein OAG24_00125 [bacterium]|nr:hypothetical protein [bacterium]